MIKPKQNWVINCFFEWYIARITKKHFNLLSYDGVALDPQKSVLLLANHFSWWDGFLLLHFNKIYLKKKFYVMIMESTAKQLWFMKYIGAFSVNPVNKSVFESLIYAGQLLNNPDNLVLIFPQGKLHSMHHGKIEFQKGLSKIIESSKKQFQFLFAALLIDYFEHKKPSLHIYLKTHTALELNSISEIEMAYNQHYQKALNLQAKVVV